MTNDRTSGREPPRADQVVVKPDFGAAASRNQPISNEDLLGFVDGALDDDGRVRVLTSIAAHPAALERVEDYLQQNARLRQLRDHLPLADSRAFAAPLQAAIAARLAQRRQHAGWRRLAAAAAIAAAVVGSAAGLALLPWDDPVQTARHEPGPGAAQAVFLFGDATLDMPPSQPPEGETLPRVDTADHASVVALEGDIGLTVPELDHLGLQLVDDDLLDRDSARAIRAVYRGETGKPIVLFAGIGKPDVRHAFWLEREGYVSLQWRRGALIFALVAPTDTPQLSAIVEQVGAAVARIQLPDTAAVPTAVNPEPAAIVEPEQAAAEGGPVQSIAVPVTAPATASTDPVATAAPETISPDSLSQSVEGNAPEPL